MVDEHVLEVWDELNAGRGRVRRLLLCCEGR